ncbi:MAG: hypothetical protein IK002_10730 [Treponema sp.]|uniref:hypothetical protein n=1 Tax=Treponema sp. TaxID=166 RepID=UPI00298EC102|nr:hypothetical protein [Treponema sp.]MBR5934447.1 hypothetical protein [Treponema sp.]
MKKLTCAILIISHLTFLAAAQNKKADPEVRFIKGNIQEKIAAVKDADKDVSSKMSLKAVNFVLENMHIIADDRDLAGLAIAAVMTYPVSEFNADREGTINRLGSIYYGFRDSNVRIAVLDKFELFAKKSDSQEIVHFVNNYLKAAQEDKTQATEVECKAIDVLAVIGNNESFEILYSSCKNKTWPKLEKNLINTLASLIEKSSSELVTIISKSDFAEMQKIYSVFVDNDKISSSVRSETAENLLNNSMIIIRDSSSVTKEIAQFQLGVCKVLSDNNWTRSSSLMISYFEVAKREFEAGFISDSDFANVIRYIEKLSSKDSVRLFVDYLGDLNMEMNKGNLPALNVVSAVIQALGDLGDKSSFDCLLYTTYLAYPENIVTQARNALSSLKW